MFSQSFSQNREDHFWELCFVSSLGIDFTKLQPKAFVWVDA